MDALNARTEHSKQRFHNVIYSNVLTIIVCNLYDRLALHMLHVSVLSKWFQSYFKHFKTIMANRVHLKCLWRKCNIYALFIGLKILAKFSYRSITEICLFESGALSRGLWCTLWRTCHLMGAELGDRLFGQNKYSWHSHIFFHYDVFWIIFFLIYLIDLNYHFVCVCVCVCVFFGLSSILLISPHF